jgi:diguanylate cyclase (GGDEF)-like protein
LYLLFFIDLDGLKQINDNIGHEAGDFVIRGTDIVARIGGDEFAAIAMDTTSEEAKFILEHLETNIERFNAVAGKPYEIKRLKKLKRDLVALM